MSIAHRAVRAYLAVTRAQAPWRSAESVDQAVARRPERRRMPPPGRDVRVETAEDDGLPVVRLVPPRAHGTLLALHGGCYLFGPEAQHWTFWRRIALASGRTVVAPLYRRAPEGQAAQTVPWVAALAERAAGPVALLGDSAGGGMALAAALILREHGLQPPLLLSAPWLDATMDAPWGMERDPWLAAPGMRHAAELYRGALPIEHAFVSPLLADLDGLGPIVVASGTRDLLHRDALRLADRVPGTRLLTGSGLLHNYPLLPIPEARPAIRAFVDALR